jgi:hypothetical protein
LQDVASIAIHCPSFKQEIGHARSEHSQFPGGIAMKHPGTSQSSNNQNIPK